MVTGLWNLNVEKTSEFMRFPGGFKALGNKKIRDLKWWDLPSYPWTCIHGTTAIVAIVQIE